MNHQHYSKEISKFSSLAQSWWSPEGPMKPLHALNALRFKALIETIGKPQSLHPLENMSILDAGCGGGLFAETLSIAGAHVTGVDASFELIEVARQHAQHTALPIKYVHADLTSPEISPLLTERFHCVTCLEVLEHVENPQSLLHTLSDYVQPQGFLVLSTINRTLKATLQAVFLAEYVLGMLPRNTHNPKKFLKPSELREALPEMNTVACFGFPFQIKTWMWTTSHNNLDVNYMIIFQKN